MGAQALIAAGCALIGLIILAGLLFIARRDGKAAATAANLTVTTDQTHAMLKAAAAGPADTGAVIRELRDGSF